METIWEDLRERFEASEISPQLRALLRDRRARVAKGEARLLDWDTAGMFTNTESQASNPRAL